MNEATHHRGVARQPADWMRPIDERILEYLRDEGNLTPAALEKFDVTSATHASNRLSRMAEYGLVERVHHGLYRLSDSGEAYLNEELDASALDPVS